MTPILADFTIDPATLNWLIGGTLAVLSTVGGGLWMALRKLCEFLKPHVVGFFTSHKTLVDTMSDQVPKLNATLERLSITQEKHGDILSLHGETLVQIRSRLDSAKSPT